MSASHLKETPASAGELWRVYLAFKSEHYLKPPKRELKVEYAHRVFVTPISHDKSLCVVYPPASTEGLFHSILKSFFHPLRRVGV
ncbi:hypothetical protein [Helicobacter cynogastricus]|uniref:hypothetical protein n=1 Tax=Helicobacter cynogastricus TaxID=329937 RepID=UPI000CF1721B|nr:hypothetical protein [Helicobacter cynogastricus]